MSGDDDLHRFVTDFPDYDPDMATNTKPDPKQKKEYLETKVEAVLHNQIVDYWSDDEGWWIKIRNPKTGSVVKLPRGNNTQEISQIFLDAVEQKATQLIQFMPELLSQIEIDDEPLLPQKFKDEFTKLENEKFDAEQKYKNAMRDLAKNYSSDR